MTYKQFIGAKGEESAVKLLENNGFTILKRNYSVHNVGEIDIIAGKAGDKAETIYEIADLTYHVMVLMIQMGISLEDIHRELASRHVIDHKVKQEKMTGK